VYNLLSTALIAAFNQHYTVLAVNEVNILFSLEYDNNLLSLFKSVNNSVMTTIAQVST